MAEDNEKIVKALGFVAKVCLEAYCKGFDDGKKAQSKLDKEMYEQVNETFENMCDIINKYNEIFEGE